MRVLYVSRSFGVHDRRFVDGWRAEGAEVYAVARDGTAPGQQSIGKELATTLRKALDDRRPDVVHAGPLTDVAPEVAALWEGPLIATSWGFDLMDEIWRDDAARRRATALMKRADIVHVDNDAAADVARQMGVDADSLIQFPWGIDLGRFRPGVGLLRRRLGWEDQLVVLSTRRHEPLYQVEIVVQAFADASAEIPRLRLILAGSGTGTRTLLTTIERAGLSELVYVAGELGPADLPDAYRSADLYVSTSTTDGTSISLLEAMACELAVCVTDVPGNRQWVTPYTGEVFPVGDAATLADRLRALTDPTARQARRDRAVTAAARVHRHADWSANRALLRRAADRAIAQSGRSA